MSKLRLDKIDAARRQLNAAVRLTFAGEDPVAIHTVVFAAHRIIRDLCEKRGNVESYVHFKDWINPGHEAEFWRFWNASSNFLKHADSDGDATHELNVEATDFIIILTSRWYRDLGYDVTPELMCFFGWWALLHPNLLKPGFFALAGVANLENVYRAARHEITSLSRSEQLQAGRLALQQALSQPRAAQHVV